MKPFTQYIHVLLANLDFTLEEIPPEFITLSPSNHFAAKDIGLANVYHNYHVKSYTPHIPIGSNAAELVTLVHRLSAKRCPKLQARSLLWDWLLGQREASTPLSFHSSPEPKYRIK